MPTRKHLAPGLGAAFLGFCIAMGSAFVEISPAGGAERLRTFTRGELAVETADGARHRFRVELALTPAQQAQGLMYRRRLEEDAGMLFVYTMDWPVAMWMKNTFIPLDLLFIGRDGRIVYVAERAVPLSRATISAGQPVAGVLELNGGTVARLGLGVGDRVEHPAFRTGP